MNDTQWGMIELLDSPDKNSAWNNRDKFEILKREQNSRLLMIKVCLQIMPYIPLYRLK